MYYNVVNNYLKEIAAEYKVDWEPTDLGIEADSLGPVISPSGFSIPIAPCSSLNNAYRPPEKVNTLYIFLFVIFNYNLSNIFIIQKSVEEERTFFPPPVIQNSNQSPSNIQAVKSLPPSAYNPAYNETLNTVPVVTLPVNNNESNKKVRFTYIYIYLIFEVIYSIFIFIS